MLAFRWGKIRLFDLNIERSKKKKKKKKKKPHTARKKAVKRYVHGIKRRENEKVSNTDRKQYKMLIAECSKCFRQGET